MLSSLLGGPFHGNRAIYFRQPAQPTEGATRRWSTTALEDFIGSLAAILTTVSFVPQAVKVVRERQTAGISLGMYVLFTVGVALWFVYGLIIGRFPIYMANGITLALASVILTMKIRLG